MQLSKRLQAVADLVTPGHRVADIGCDHAYISIYLTEQEISPHVIAMDINQGPIDRANVNIVKYGYQNRIEVRKSDGLEKLGTSEADTVILAGMGGALTIQILSGRADILKNVKELVLQPQSEINKVRRFLCDNAFLITEENMLKEDGKYYVMIKAKPRRMLKDITPFLLSTEEHFQYGRLLLEQKNPVLHEFLNWDYDICGTILKNLEEEQTQNALLRREEVLEKMQLIQCGLTYF